MGWNEAGKTGVGEVENGEERKITEVRDDRSTERQVRQ
jgi:hypothetical protein